MVIPSTFLLLALTLILSLDLLTSLSPQPSMVSTNPEIAALSALKNSLSDPNNELHSWVPEYADDPCTWFHIICNDQNHVIRVDLAMANLTGKLVPDLGNLTQLQFLVMYQNNIEGVIPEEFGKLTNLVGLDLSENNLLGFLPSSLENLKASLRILRLNSNRFLTVDVPPGLVNVPILDISNTSLTIPPRGRPFV